MVLKEGLEENEVMDVLDSIGCNCGGDNCGSKENSLDKTHEHEHVHNHDHNHEADILSVIDGIGCDCGDENCQEDVVLNTLDEIGCNCGSDSCSSHEIKEESNHKESKFISKLKENWSLWLSFVVFFVTIFASFNEGVELGLFLVAYLLIARPVLKSAVNSVVKGRMLDENFLMAVASIVAFLIGEYAEGVAVMLFYKVGQLTEDYAINKSKRSISSLLDLKAEYANVKTAFGLQKLKPNDVHIDDVIVIKPGEKVPLDGVVISGESHFDTAMLTGESLPSVAVTGTPVFAGTVNLNGAVEVRVTKESKNSTVSRILSMVAKANENKAETETFITKFAKYYTPAVVIGAVLLSVIPPIILQESFQTWLYRGAIFLVVSCPCALVISVPLGYFGGIGGAAKKGILVKGGQYLEAIKNVDTIVFDKTGTLTKGNFVVSSKKLIDIKENKFLELAAHLESMSNHPIGQAVVGAYNGIVDENAVSNFEEIPGKGIKGLYKNETVMIGNKALMDDANIAIDTVNGTVLYMTVDQKYVGYLIIEDEVKNETVQGLSELRRLGVKRFVMLTGDQKYVANKIGKELGIDDIHSELLPEDKLDILESYLGEGKVAFVGDGINDAPVIRRADVGIAMGHLGADVAVESSDIVLMKDEVTTVAETIKTARFTSKIIWQNIILALTVKAIIMVLGAIGIANLWIAVFGDVGVAFIAILNSSRAIYQKGLKI